MLTRVSTKSINDSILNYLNKNQSTLSDLVSQVSSRTKVDSVSDDVSAGMAILSTTDSLAKIDTYQTNVSYGLSEIDTTDSTLSGVSDAVQSIIELVTQASNSTYTADDLTAINKQIQSYKDTILSLANTEYAGKYIFSGTNTSTAAYTKDSATEAVTYHGTSSSGEYERKTQISDGVTVTTNVCGEDVFGYSTYTDAGGSVVPGTGLFGTIDTISSLLTADPIDYTAISSTIDDLNTALDTVTSSRATLAGIYNRLEMADDQLTTAKTNYTSLLSDAKDIDYASSVSDLTAAQTAYEASLSVSSKIMNLSLLDYM